MDTIKDIRCLMTEITKSQCELAASIVRCDQQIELIKSKLNMTQLKPESQLHEVVVVKPVKKKACLKMILAVVDDYDTRDTRDRLTTITLAMITLGGSKSHYDDSICMDDIGKIVRISGQKTGRDDYIIKDAIKRNENIHVFARRNKTDPFRYLGFGKGMILKERSDNGTTIFNVRVDKNDIHNDIVPEKNPKGRGLLFCERLLYLS